jgi:hypothetical protein
MTACDLEEALTKSKKRKATGIDKVNLEMLNYVGVDMKAVNITVIKCTLAILLNTQQLAGSKIHICV